MEIEKACVYFLYIMQTVFDITICKQSMIYTGQALFYSYQYFNILQTSHSEGLLPFCDAWNSWQIDTRTIINPDVIWQPIRWCLVCRTTCYLEPKVLWLSINVLYNLKKYNDKTWHHQNLLEWQADLKYHNTFTANHICMYNTEWVARIDSYNKETNAW